MCDTFLPSRQLRVSSSSGYENNEDWRIRRLERVAGYIYARAEIGANLQIYAKLAKLHNHKGTLIVTWKSDPTDAEKRMLDEAWASPIGDVLPYVEHQVGAG